jgi:hypothetical protein
MEKYSTPPKHDTGHGGVFFQETNLMFNLLTERKLEMKGIIIVVVAIVILISLAAGNDDTSASGTGSTSSASSNSDNSGRILSLAEEGTDLSDELVSDSTLASDMANAGDGASACALVPSMESKVERLAEIVYELDDLGQDTSEIPLSKMQANMSTVSSLCDDLGY